MDKKALLSELAIDRDSDASPSSARPLKWLLLIAVVGGVGFAAFTWVLPIEASPVEVRTAVVEELAAAAAGDSVLDATGYVVARRQATVSSKTTGKVVEVLVEEGMYVEEGQLLAQLDDSITRAQLELSESQLRASRASLDEMMVQLRQAQLDLARTSGLAERKLASQADLDRDTLAVEGLTARLARVEQELNVAERHADVQRQMLADMQIRAPFAGVVVAKAAQPGEMISPVSAGGGFTRTGICTIVDMDSLEVEVDVNEAYINRVFPGQPATVALNAYPDVQIPASVIAIIPTADRNKATVRVRIRILDRDDRVLPDMGVKVRFLDDEPTPPPVTATGVVVPADAVTETGDEAYVWVVREDRVARRRVVVAGPHGERLRVVAGLAGGERVVSFPSDASGDRSLTDGDLVQVVN
ncbi:MAG: efflux RND transporter periplasmic adaptor subunit [Gammaproteobacteria bacterium]|nr:efflux RND transporter periplasmic adaptor subunit [Gammaproteobacteria bacterium]